MKKTIFVFFSCILIFITSCKEDSTSPSNGNNTTPTTGWVLDYYDYNIGTLFCTWPNPCLIDIVTDTINLTKNDSMRIFMSYHSVRNNKLTIIKVPYPVEFFNCTFPDSSYGRIDTVITLFNTKIILDFGFEIGTRFTIDTLQIYKKQ